MSWFSGAICVGADQLPDALLHEFQRATHESNQHIATISNRAVLGWDGIDQRVSVVQNDRGIVARVGDFVHGALASATPGEQSATLLSSPEAFLSNCRGSFACAALTSDPLQSFIASDFLGVRNLYWIVQDAILVFATSLARLTAMRWLRLSMDMTGILEEATFGYALAGRTPFSGVHCVREASLVSATAHGAVEKAYAPFAGDSESPLDLEASAETLLRTFRESVALRAHSETCVLGISGGMDSRLLAGVLKERGHRVVTINMSPPGSQDRYFAKVASAAMGVEYFEFDFEFADDLPRTSRMSELLTTGDLRDVGVAAGGLLWTGDGGSVGLGGVLIDDEPLAPLASHRSTSIVSRSYLEHNRLAPSVGVFARRWREDFAAIPARNMDVELDRWQLADRRRQLQLFLLTNDQRRHLQTTWESFERLRIDFALPFFDAALIRLELAVPLDWILKHRAYQRLIQDVPGAATVPWQTYPGHEPCPLPSPPGLSYQWDQSRRSTYRAPGAMRRALASKAVAALNSGQIPSELLDRPRILAYAAAHASGTRDCESQLKLVLSLARAAKVAPRSWAVPSAGRLSA